MKTTVYSFAPQPQAPTQAEPLDDAVREVSARVAQNNEERRRLHSRLGELRGLSPGLRRRRARQAPPAMSRPVTFYAIEEAEASEPERPRAA